MMILRRILLKLRRRQHFERDVEAEIAFHRDLARKHSNAIGLGNVSRIQEEARDLWRFSLAEDFWSDAGYAVRSLRRTPGFAGVAILPWLSESEPTRPSSRSFTVSCWRHCLLKNRSS